MTAGVDGIEFAVASFVAVATVAGVTAVATGPLPRAGSQTGEWIGDLVLAAGGYWMVSWQLFCQ